MDLNQQDLCALHASWRVHEPLGHFVYLRPELCKSDQYSVHGRKAKKWIWQTDSVRRIILALLSVYYAGLEELKYNGATTRPLPITWFAPTAIYGKLVPINNYCRRFNSQVWILREKNQNKRSHVSPATDSSGWRINETVAGETSFCLFLFCLIFTLSIGNLVADLKWLLSWQYGHKEFMLKCPWKVAQTSSLL